MIFLVAALLGLASPDRPRTIVVAPGGEATTIATALRLARPGDTVVVTAGVYREPRLDVHVDLATVDAKSHRHGRSPIALLFHNPLTRPRV